MEANPAEIEPMPLDEGRRKANGFKTLKRVLKWALFLALIYFVGRAIVHQLSLIDWSTLHFRALPLVGAFVVLTVIYAARTFSFRFLLDGYGITLPWSQTNVVAWIPQIGKYIPGQIASIAGAVGLLRRFGVGGAVSLSVVLVMDGIAVLTGLITGSPLLLWEPVKRVFPLGWIGCLVVVVGGAVALHPKVFGKLLNLALAKMKRPPVEAIPRVIDYVVPMLLGFLQWILAGLALWLIARSVTDVSPRHLGLFIPIAGLAYTVSYLTPFAPGGLGVREAIFGATLVVLIGSPAAVVVVVMRLIQTFVEVLMAFAGWVLLKREDAQT